MGETPALQKGEDPTQTPYFSEKTVDDLMHVVVEAVLADGSQINPSKGPALELAGVLLELRDPRARLSRTETRGKAFSCLGEFCWYLAGSDKLDFIEHYLSPYVQYAEDGVIRGAYGPRLFAWKGQNQVQGVIDRLKVNPDSRKGVIQLFDAEDLVAGLIETPCTCTLQFLLRQGRVHMLVNMRSNDVIKGLPHDIFAFTMLQEIVARSLSAETGWYRHAVGSLHIYDRDDEVARAFVGEGWQSTTAKMPPMPQGNPWAALNRVLEAEQRLRQGEDLPGGLLTGLDPYWADLVRLLMVHAAAKSKDATRVAAIRDKMTAALYRVFIDARLARMLETTS